MKCKILGIIKSHFTLILSGEIVRHSSDIELGQNAILARNCCSVAPEATGPLTCGLRNRTGGNMDEQEARKQSGRSTVHMRSPDCQPGNAIQEELTRAVLQLVNVV